MMQSGYGRAVCFSDYRENQSGDAVDETTPYRFCAISLLIRTHRIPIGWMDLPDF